MSLKKIDPLELFMWTFRRNEKDVVNLYNSLSDIMRLATGGNMLNFGYWEESTKSPLEAQKNLSSILAKKAALESKKDVIDVGSGLGAPAFQWSQDYPESKITSININYNQLRNSLQNHSAQLETSSNKRNQQVSFINSTATLLPFADESVDCVISLEAAQHFKPLKNFLSETFRVLKKNGNFALAIPVMKKKKKSPILQLGILSMTWSSEHYDEDFVKSSLLDEGFRLHGIEKIGSKVYEPLAKFYLDHRESLRKKILTKYPSYVEKILYKSIMKMNSVSIDKTIDYLLINCKK